MSGCKTIKFLFDLLPLKFWRGYLIRRHIEKCPVCEKKLIQREATRTLLAQEDAGGPAGLWPGIRAGLKKPAEETRRWQSTARTWRRWALGAAGLLIAVLAGFWIYQGSQSGRIQSRDETGREFQIQYIKVGNAPARPFVYQPQDTNIIIIWAEKTLNGG
jgi:hypothetical protein